jgi:hypothetical protein
MSLANAGLFLLEQRMAKLSPLFNEAQFIDGVPAVGAKVFTYASGSSTKVASYTTEDGDVAQANPIILNARGEPDSPIWLTEGQTYKFVFTSSTDTDPPTSPIRTIDDVTGVGDNSVTIDQWVESGVTPTYVSATQFTVPGDQTSAFHVSRRIKATVTAGTVFGYISASVFGALTTVTVVLDSGVLDSGLSAVQLGLITADDTSLPKIPLWVDSPMLANDAVIARTLNDSALGFALINGYLTATVAANALTVAIKTKAGADPSATDPVLVVFRNATLATGDYVVRSVTAATSVVVSSGSTLGTTSAVASTIQVLAIDNSGTVELAVVNNSGALRLNEYSLLTTVAEGGAGAADSADVVYSTTLRTNVPYRNIGYIFSTQATAGTWASSPTQIGLYPSTPVAKGDTWVYMPEYTTTGGTSIPITGFPSWVQDIELFLELSTNGTSDLVYQIGDAGGIENTSYDSLILQGAGAGNALTTFTASFGLANMIAADTVKGKVKLSLQDGDDFTWYSEGRLGRSAGPAMNTSQGTKSLSATLTQLLITTAGGANTFDVVKVRARYK